VTNEIRRNDEAGQYEIVDAEGKVIALTQFRVRGDHVVMPHTESDPAHKGEGLAAQVVTFALDDIRASGRTVVPTCPFVKHFIETHPEYQDLVAP
jgi:predicted GNAT family acetyltransferase